MSRRGSSLLVIRLSALGDVIHTLPAVAMMRDARSDLEISWVVEKAYAELVEIVGRVRAIPVQLKKKRVREALRSVRGFDAAVDFQGLLKSSVLAWSSGARERYGFDRAAIREKAAGLFLNRRVAVDRTQHVVDWNIQLARALAPAAAVPELDFAPFATNDEGRRTNDAVVLLPGAGRPEKLWPVSYFRELARNLGGRALVVWGPGERAMAEAIGASLAPPTNLRELAAVLKDAAVVVGADTGPLHLAAALGTPVVGLYGPTDPRRNGPYGQLQGCVDHFRSTKSMESITVPEVMMKIEEAVAR